MQTLLAYLASLTADHIDDGLLKEFYTMDHDTLPWDDEEDEQSFDAFYDDGDWTPPAPNQRYTVGQRCPQCGNMMELKTNTRTNHKFVGCTNYPTCIVAGKSR